MHNGVRYRGAWREWGINVTLRSVLSSIYSRWLICICTASQRLYTIEQLVSCLEYNTYALEMFFCRNLCQKILNTMLCTINIPLYVVLENHVSPSSRAETSPIDASSSLWSSTGEAIVLLYRNYNHLRNRRINRSDSSFHACTAAGWAGVIRQPSLVNDHPARSPYRPSTLTHPKPSTFEERAVYTPACSYSLVELASENGSRGVAREVRH